MKKIILGLVGEIASGKSAIADFLVKEFNSETASFSDPLRQTLNILGLPQSRENMVWLGVDLRQRFGQDILAKAVFEKIKKSQSDIICLPNIRLEGDVEFLSKLPSFYLINVVADPEIRYNRLITRGENSDDRTKTWDQFLADAELPTEISIREIAKQAQFTIENNACESNLFKRMLAIFEIIRREQ